jgi:hypothetical protein
MTLSRRAALVAAVVVLAALVLTGVITASATLAIEQQRISTCLLSSAPELPPATATRCAEAFPGFSQLQAESAMLAGLADQAARQQDADRKRQADLETKVRQLQHALDQLTD